MKRFATLLFLVLPVLTSAAVDAIKCDLAIPVTGASTAKRPRSDSELLTCPVTGLAGLGLETVIDSSLAQARGQLLVRFEDRSGRVLWTWKSEPFVGQFSGLGFQKVVPVPTGAERAVVLLHIEGDHNEATGAFGAVIRRVEPGAVVQLEPKNLPVVSEGSAHDWFVSAGPASPTFPMQIKVLDLEGSIAYSATWNVATAKSFAYRIPPLPVGYYTLVTHADIPGQLIPQLERSFAVIPTGNAPQESRIGIDAALSWYGGQTGDIERALDLMHLAGVGSVRDRLRWSQVQPNSETTEWGRYKTVAEQVARRGFKLVTTFHDSPSWTRGYSQSKPDDRRPPLDTVAARRFGEIFARDMGKHLRAIEFWNEQNSAFFYGYPYQYANAMKAFFEGVKSVDPSLIVLIGAAAARPGPFFEEIYQNNLAAFFDVRNQHYYGPAEGLSQFVATQVAPHEQVAGVDRKPGWLTEIGFSLRRDEQGGIKKAEMEQAVYLTKAYAEGFAAGYERVFFFFLRELIESNYHNWGILRTDYSPRPAYSALAALTRHIAGQKLVGAFRGGSSRSVFWKDKDGGYSAVVWGDGLANELLGSFSGAKDLFGRPIQQTIDAIRLSGAPLLISGISKLPEGSSLITFPQETTEKAPHLRLSVEVAVDGRDIASTRENRVNLPVRNGAELVLHGRVFSSPKGGEESESISLTCEPGNGITVEGTSEFNLAQANGGMPFQCRFNPQLLNVGQSFVRVTASINGEKETAQLALEPDAEKLGNVSVRPLQRTPHSCAVWHGRASKNIALRTVVIPISGGACGGVQVESAIRDSGEAWVFPALPLASPMVGWRGLRVEVEPIDGTPFPPTPLMAQIVDASGGIWLLEMSKGANAGRTITYSGLFSTAKAAPWKMPSDSRLNPARAKEVMFGWGGFGGQTGQTYGYTIRTISIIDSDS